LTGIFTDSDLARLLEQNRDNALDGPITAVMTARPLTVQAGTWLSDACDLLAERKISELPVVDGELRPLGLLDITDVVACDDSYAAPAPAASLLRVVSPT
jgi:arabinose-5-phosphate isomerase